MKFALEHLAPGQALYIHGGEYEGGVESKVDGPIWVIGDPIRGPLVQPGEVTRIIDPPPAEGAIPLLRLKNRSWVVQNLEFVATIDSAQPLLLQNANDIFIADVRILEFHAGAGINVRSSNDCRVTRCTITGGKVYMRDGRPQEAVGLLVGSGSHRVLIDECSSWNNQSDSIQIQDEADNYDLDDPNRPKQDLPTDIIVQDCSLYEASGGGSAIGENAVDVKSCKRVVITGNEMYGFRSQTASPMDSKWGDAVVIHCDADEVIVEKNRIHDCGRGASVGAKGIGAGTRGVGKVIFRFNQIYDMKLQPGVGLVGSGSGIRCSPASQIEIYHNTFHALQYQQHETTGVAIRLGDDGTTTKAVVLNNIVSEVGIALTVNSVGRLGSARNIYHAASGARGQPIVINNQGVPLSSWQPGNECYTVDTDPQFWDKAAHDYRTKPIPPATQPISPARNTAVLISGSAQVVYGTGPDIGAVETP